MAEESNSGTSNPHPHPPVSDEDLGKPQVHQSVPYISSVQMYPYMSTRMFPSQNPEENDHGPGIYAIPYYSSMSPMAGFPPSTLIPLRYKIPTTPNSTSGANEEHGQEVRQQQGQQQGPQRPVVVRRFHFAFQVDLGLIVKLAAVVFLLSQDGSKHKLILLMLCASLIYLYRTGVLAPLIRWLQQAGAPPAQPRQHAHAQAQNGLVGHVDANNPQPEQNFGAERHNPDHPAEDQERPHVNENQPEPEGGRGFNWWLIVKEIQVFVIGFLTSLIPGFQNN
ncbi:hypothetical protein Cni_G27820 [Canna indica]|uniref:Uncharacterized protein n=1 Tax=Canna indica TaxID=4628 RepID=A0AAQ3L1H9_9LILI|nr:hypothetical protein Cni_G27820 [Canna indica]